jgi:hypothetical protein
MPQFTDEYKMWSDMPDRAVQPGEGGTRTIGAWRGSPAGAVGHQGGMQDSGYTYNPNWSSQDYIRENVKSDVKSPAAPWLYATPSGNAALAYRAFSGRNAFKKARNGERERARVFEEQKQNFMARRPTDYLNGYDPTSRTSQYASERLAGGKAATQEELQAVMDQEERDNLRGVATHKINDYFSDPARTNEYERLTQDQLKADTQNIGTTFDNADTKAKLAAARQGLTGGSVEAENSATLGGQRSSALVGAAQGANKTFSNLTARDRAVQDQLLSLVNSDDPYQRQAAAAQLQGMQQQTANDAYQTAADQTRQEAGQFNQNQMSQSIGGGLAGLTNLIQQDPNRGTNLSAWYGTPARS